MRRFSSFAGKGRGIAIFFLLVTPAGLHAQEDSTLPPPPALSSAQAEPENDPIPVMFPHPETDRLWISGQANFISQLHPAFHSPYQGRNSLSPEAQDASSRVLTLYTGLRVTNSAELLCDMQENRRPWNWRSARHRRIHQSRRSAQSHAQQSAVCRAFDVASRYLSQFRRCSLGADTIFIVQPPSATPH